MKSIVVFGLALLLAGCVEVAPEPDHTLWPTGSGWPEAVFVGLQPREVTGLLADKLSSLGYQPLDAHYASPKDPFSAPLQVGPSDDYHGTFVKEARAGIKYIAQFDYLSLPGKIKVIAKPKVVSLGILLAGKADEEVTKDCDTAMKAALAEMKPAK